MPDFISRHGCPACGGTSVTVFRSRFDSPLLADFLKSYYGVSRRLEGEYRVERCLNCRTLFQGEVGTPDLLEEVYDRWITSNPEKSDPHYGFSISNPRLSRDGHEIMTAAAFLLRPLSGMRTLDFGAGWAEWALVSKKLGCQSYSFDLAKSRQCVAHRHGIRTDIDGVRFDFINTEQVLEHVADPSGTVSELARKLAPGGILKISVPGQCDVEGELARLNAGKGRMDVRAIDPVQPIEHVNAFTRQGLVRLAARHGLRETKLSILQRYAFLKFEGSLSARYLKASAKELVRPLWRNRRNLYAWFQPAG